jgi:hypothetical protein
VTLVEGHPLVQEADAKLADLARRRTEFEARGPNNARICKEPSAADRRPTVQRAGA